MPIQLTNPPKHPTTGDTMTHAMADNIRISPITRVASYEMHYGKITDGVFSSLHLVARYVYRNLEAETQYGTDPETGEPGNYESIPADPAFDNLIKTAAHVIDGTEQVGDVITAYDLISENAIYTHEIATRPELFAGVIL